MSKSSKAVCVNNSGLFAVLAKKVDENLCALAQENAVEASHLRNYYVHSCLTISTPAEAVQRTVELADASVVPASTQGSFTAVLKNSASLAVSSYSSSSIYDVHVEPERESCPSDKIEPSADNDVPFNKVEDVMQQQNEVALEATGIDNEAASDEPLPSKPRTEAAKHYKVQESFSEKEQTVLVAHVEDQDVYVYQKHFLPPVPKGKSYHAKVLLPDLQIKKMHRILRLNPLTRNEYAVGKPCALHMTVACTEGLSPTVLQGWYRGRIEKILVQKGKVSVRLVDVGLLETIDLSVDGAGDRLKALPSKMNGPPKAYVLLLAGSLKEFLESAIKSEVLGTYLKPTMVMDVVLCLESATEMYNQPGMKVWPMSSLGDTRSGKELKAFWQQKMDSSELSVVGKRAVPELSNQRLFHSLTHGMSADNFSGDSSVTVHTVKPMEQKRRTDAHDDGASYQTSLSLNSVASLPTEKKELIRRWINQQN